ncbi:HNH endonuclease family protein [Kitasatospora sp. NPDC048286]|uniref:HNH endonuclease family protein n=1 Tax=Kitasatospora sp. NPDC048286 TaxID=3364047 RepID=UPI003710FB91
MAPTAPARRFLSAIPAAAALAAVTVVTAGTPAQAALPTPISAATARSYLAAMPATAETHGNTYDRTLFPTWITISGTCDTREWVVKRDGSNVATDTSCKSTSGNWSSPYDGATTTNASSFDVDHLVPLSEAWASGAWSWTTAQRQAFANDVTRPQLLLVSASSNRSKGDRDPAEWLPQASYRCTYARAWVQVKQYYGLGVDSAEKTALTGILNNC